MLVLCQLLRKTVSACVKKKKKKKKKNGIHFLQLSTPTPYFLFLLFCQPFVTVPLFGCFYMKAVGFWSAFSFLSFLCVVLLWA